MNLRRYILKSKHLTDAEKDSIKGHVVADIQRNESVVLENNAGNNETDEYNQPTIVWKLQQPKMITTYPRIAKLK